jgi:hypothetical protein
MTPSPETRHIDDTYSPPHRRKRHIDDDFSRKMTHRVRCAAQFSDKIRSHQLSTFRPTKMQPRGPNQTLSSYISEHLDEIEKLISVGVYQDSICQQLTLLGFTPTLAAFKKSLTRARHKRLVHATTKVRSNGNTHTTVIKGNRLSADEFALLERNSPLQTQTITAI